ncbi:diguanylate cyclase (GGDEF) domain-containing protein [Butyrivibrio proteoclasticus]|uniref:Diguanylate cyclase (GGDEF) domain-containing protein n=1 Tax=Butyrivibrio proteoclasticus TaxID=43305 RepID=A0A1I5Q912_9FIRM|nr:GGDEF domain-containing protein [Butyrivibrio proteoclasticus]SFP42763.1 diguanylate cyclase (GGDEF) domain-containing protein [Butyrivibrio proteoclasticus]
MPGINYETLKTIVNMCNMPSAILSVEKNDDGTCGKILMAATNDKFSMTGENVEGQRYDLKIPRDPKFEDILFKAAWNNEHYHAYVDTTRLYGYWTEDIVIPINNDNDPKIGYCQFIYILSKEMDSGKYSIISPDIASFVIRTCLNLRKNDDFYTTMNLVTKEIREFTNSFATSIVTISKDLYQFEIISESVRNNLVNIHDIFTDIPYEIVESWEDLISGTDCIIIRNEQDMYDIEKRAPEWVKTLRENDVKSLCLAPFIHQNIVIGYLFITNFDVSQLARFKDTIEMVAFFLASEVAHHIFIDRLRSLSSLDLRTGVQNRNAMNTKVDELAMELKMSPAPYSVAFCTLSTLKTININQGHDAGNNLLRDAGKILREVFEDDFIYRSAGDEFAIISTNSSEKEFSQKIESLKNKASDPNWVYFTVGYYTDTTDGSLHTAMRFANQYGQEFKEEFYYTHPEMIK